MERGSTWLSVGMHGPLRSGNCEGIATQEGAGPAPTIPLLQRCAAIGLILMFRNETWPWSPWRAIEPVLDLAKSGILENLLLATRLLKSSLPRTYSKYFTPLISCTHFSGVISRRTWFHSPTGLVASSGLPVLGSIGGW